MMLRATRADVLAAIAAEFPEQDREAVREIIDEYGHGHEWHHRERERVQATITMRSAGDIEWVRLYTDTAKIDFRDVVASVSLEELSDWLIKKGYKQDDPS
jgi:hypothetical protein